MDTEEIQELVQYVRSRMVADKYGNELANFDITDKIYDSSDKLNYQQNRACRVSRSTDGVRYHLYCAVLKGDKIIFYKNDTKKFTIDFDGDYDEARKTWNSIFELKLLD